MPDLLLELLSEEIPAGMQRKAAEDLKKRVTEALVDRGFLYEGAKAYATPRRLALHIVGLPVRGQDRREERKGPRIDAPDAAIQGFLKSAGLDSIDQAERVTDSKKGDFYVARSNQPGRATIDVMSDLLPSIIRAFPWPKSMRWGEASREPGSLRWVRPLHSILCTFGPETETPNIVPFSVDGIPSGATTQGHRFLSPEPFETRRFEDYAASLHRAKVLLDLDARKDIIRCDAQNLAFAQGLEWIEDDALLEEVAGLVEWPVVLMGAFDEAFLDIPPEVIRATIRANQKCFVLSKADAQASLSNRFILVSNLEARDGGTAIIAGNERVVRARLSDARFFWETDRKTKLEDRLEKLKSIVFHEKLGTQFERVERIEALAVEIGKTVLKREEKGEGNEQEKPSFLAAIGRAARLAKADLVTEMVGEFPELQGLMGRYYALAQGETPQIAAAIEDHYKPLGPSDRVPTDPLAIAVALADKIDMLVGFWSIDEKPTGSKDPYALRRAALGVIRIVLENKLRVDWSSLLGTLFSRSAKTIDWPRFQIPKAQVEALEQEGLSKESSFKNLQEIAASSTPTQENFERTAREMWPRSENLFKFLLERLKVYLRDSGASHDIIDAVLAIQKEADFDLMAQRIESLQEVLETPPGKDLLAAYRRAANILRAEERKEGAGAFDDGSVGRETALAEPEEEALSQTLETMLPAFRDDLTREDFKSATLRLAGIRPAIDAFLDRVTVNAENASVRLWRLQLLARFRSATLEIADLSRIEGE